MSTVALPFELNPTLTTTADGVLKLQITINHKLISGKEYVAKKFKIKLQYSEQELKFASSLKKTEKETEIKVSQDKGVVLVETRTSHGASEI